MNNKVLLINDLPGYGKVALSAMLPVLTHMGYDLYNLPTALVSNTLDYGKFEILETTEYMRNSIKVWNELGFDFDAISTGFIITNEQVKMIKDFCSNQKDTLVFCDPIMADDGKLYNGISNDTIKNMQELVSISDYIVPNYTEACFLSNKPYKEKTNLEEINEIILELRKLGCKSIVITSCVFDDYHAVVCYDEKSNQTFVCPFDAIDVRFPGTGDIFSAIFMGCVLKKIPLKESVQRAMNSVYALIKNNKDNADKFKGIPIESCLEVLDVK